LIISKDDSFSLPLLQAFVTHKIIIRKSG